MKAMVNLPLQSAYRAVTKTTTSSLPKYFRKDEIERIMSACEEKDERELALLIDFLWKTGVKISELISIRFSNIDPYAKTLRVVTLRKPRKKVKGRKRAIRAERVIPLPDDLLNRINTFRLEGLGRKGLERKGLGRKLNPTSLTTTSLFDNDLIFPYSRVTAFRRVKKACALAGLDDDRAHPSTFRHSFAIHLLRNGVPVTMVQRLLGHSSIENTAIYLAVVQSEILRSL